MGPTVIYPTSARLWLALLNSLEQEERYEHAASPSQVALGANAPTECKQSSRARGGGYAAPEIQGTSEV